MSNINLLPNKKKSTSSREIEADKFRLMRFFAMALLFGVSTASVILFLLISLSPLPQLKKQEEKGLANMALFHGDIAKLQVVNERTDSISTILSKRLTIDKTLDSIRSKLPAGCEISAFAMEKGSITVTVSSKSLSLLNDFLNNIVDTANRKEEFSQVKLSSLVADDQTSNYLLTVALTPITL